jgi:hypothetical protein
MTLNMVFHTPYEKAIYEGSGLDIPLKHLLGNRIGIFPQSSPIINVSAWRADKRKSSYDGIIHIHSPYQEDMVLVEDIVVGGGRPADFPMVSERITFPDLARVSLYYPRSSQFWLFNIHLRYKGLPKEELELISEERLSSSGSSGLFSLVG